MNIPVWLAAIAAVSLIIFLLRQRISTPDDDTSPNRLALLVGTRRAWGESDASLRNRSMALSRWPYTKEEPVLAWWARLWWRMRRRTP